MNKSRVGLSGPKTKSLTENTLACWEVYFAHRLRSAIGFAMLVLVHFQSLNAQTAGGTTDKPTSSPHSPIAEPTSQAFHEVVLATLSDNCIHCHGSSGTLEGELDLERMDRAELFQQQPIVLEKIIKALDSGHMPPEGEGELLPELRAQMVHELKILFAAAVAQRPQTQLPSVRRMTRFQYNNAVKDLFQLKVEVFPLPERMLREYNKYFRPDTASMPDVVRVGSRPLGKSQMIEAHLGGVTPFPQDLRAEHGFDNRIDHLTLSPALLEAFIRLSSSIVDSHDFNESTCGIWHEFFEPPADVLPEDLPADIGGAIRNRLGHFLPRAFRQPVDVETVERYTQHGLRHLAEGATFEAAMKAVAAATLSSPRFFYLYQLPPSLAPARTGSQNGEAYNLASRLAFFLWGSLPDAELLELAKTNELALPEILESQVDRMLVDPRLKRFCDSFPAQWLQLERIVSSEPDVDLYPQFYFAKYRVSMHMMAEPLLIFETVLVENQSILQFIDSDFSYRSDLLDAWYDNGSQGKPGSPTTLEFHRVSLDDRRQGGLITNAAVLTMTSGTIRTKPISRGSWLATIIFNDPPPPPPGDVLPLTDQPRPSEEHLTLKQRFEAHRTDANCASCHQKIDPLGFALEQYDAVGRWRATYENGQTIDTSGQLFGTYEFQDIIGFKDVLLAEKDRFTRSLAAHLLSFALGRELTVYDAPSLDWIAQRTAEDEYRIHALIKNVVLSDSFCR